MGEEELRSACETEGIALPESQEAPLLLRAMRSRLRQALRWQHLDTEQLRKACELRHFDFIGKDRSQLLQQLRSFKVIPQPKSSPKVEPRRASAKSSASRRAAPSPEEDIQDGTGDYPSWMSERLRKACAKYPNFSGNFVQEMEEWSVQDVEMYLYSNGFLRPKKATARRSVPRAVLRAHYQLLGLEEGANATEIRKAYRRLALIYHPDKNPEDPDAAAETFRRLAEAYEVLTANLNVEDVRPPSAPCPRSVSSSRRKESLHEVEPCFGGLASERGSVGSPELSTGPTPARPQIPSYSRVVKVRKVRARKAHQEEAVQDLQRIRLSPVSEEVERETDDDEPDNEVLK
eukprot:symbB.v1.2.023684.t1/scaffold2172.1/size87052/3